MDLAFKHLIDLVEKYGINSDFELDNINFFLSKEGARWLDQVDENPPKFKVSDHGRQLLRDHQSKN